MKKRWLSLAVAATAAITVLAGCGSKAAETTAAATEAATTEAASSEAAESSAEETKAEAAAEGEIPAPEGDDNKISIGVTPVPHAEIVNDVVVPKLEAAGWDVEVVEFNDYVQPNTSLEDGEIDANYFQTIRYLEEQNKERGLHLVEVAGIHLEPMGIYSKNYKSLEEIQAKAAELGVHLPFAADTSVLKETLAFAHPFPFYFWQTICYTIRND